MDKEIPARSLKFYVTIGDTERISNLQNLVQSMFRVDGELWDLLTQQ